MALGGSSGGVGVYSRRGNVHLHICQKANVYSCKRTRTHEYSSQTKPSQQHTKQIDFLIHAVQSGNWPRAIGGGLMPGCYLFAYNMHACVSIPYNPRFLDADAKNCALGAKQTKKYKRFSG